MTSHKIVSLGQRHSCVVEHMHKGWLAWVLNEPGCFAIEVCTVAGCSSSGDGFDRSD